MSQETKTISGSITETDYNDFVLVRKNLGVDNGVMIAALTRTLKALPKEQQSIFVNMVEAVKAENNKAVLGNGGLFHNPDSDKVEETKTSTKSTPAKPEAKS